MQSRYETNPNTFERWEEYYEKLNKERVIEDIINELPELKGEVLEIGCGMGNTIRELMKTNPDASFTGIDFSQTAINKAGIGNFHRMRVEDMEYENKFDWVLCFETLEHVDDPQKALENIKRAVKDDGKIIITVPFPKSNLDRGVHLHHWTFEESDFKKVFGEIKTKRVHNFWFIYA